MFEGMVQFLAGLAALDPTKLSRDQVRAALIDLASVRSQLDFQYSRLLAQFDAAEGWRSDGATSAVAWVRAHARIGPRRDQLRPGCRHYY